MKEFGPMLLLNTPGMKALTRRGVELRKRLEPYAVVIETYPRAVEKKLDLEKADLDMDFKNEDEYDAYLCATFLLKSKRKTNMRYLVRTERSSSYHLQIFRARQTVIYRMVAFPTSIRQVLSE